jgi:hypothetical protein
LAGVSQLIDLPKLLRTVEQLKICSQVPVPVWFKHVGTAGTTCETRLTTVKQLTKIITGIRFKAHHFQRPPEGLSEPVRFKFFTRINEEKCTDAPNLPDTR